MANEYGIIVKAQADTSNLNKQLNSQLRELENKTKIDIKVQTDEKALTKLHEKFKLVENDFIKIKQDIKTTFTYIDTNGVRRSVDKVTETFKNASGEVQKLETYIAHYGNVTKVLDSQVVSSTKTFDEYNNKLKETQVQLKEIQKLSQQIVYQETQTTKTGLGNKLTTTTTRNASGKEEQTKVYEYEDELGRKVQATTKYIREQGEEWQVVGRTSFKIIDDQIKKEEDLVNKQRNKITEKENALKLIFQEKEAIKQRNEEENKRKFKENEKIINNLIKEKNAIEERNEKLKESNILYEENTKVKEKNGSVTSTKIQENELGQREITQVIEKEDEKGRKIQETTKYLELQGGAWMQIGKTSTKVIDDEISKEEKEEEAIRKKNEALREEYNSQMKEAKEKVDKLHKTTASTVQYNNNYKKSIDGVTHSISEEIKYTKTLAGDLKSVTKTTDEFKDAQGNLVTKITTVNDAGDEQVQTFIKMNAQTKTLGQSFSNIIVKVAKFYLASLPIRAVQSAITNAVQSVKEFDSALTEFKKVSDLSGYSLEEYTEKLEKLGKLTARTRTEMVELATEFKRSGFDDNDAATLAQVGSLYQNIADEELSASDAASVLISQIKAFNFQAEDAEHVIDAVNEVANRNAVSSGDIGRGLTQAGAALSTYGNTFEETIGLITAGTEIFQNRSQQVARGLNTVASRIAKNEKSLQQYGVEIYDVNGDLRSTYDILKDLSPEWDKMTKKEQVALGTTLAGY